MAIGGLPVLVKMKIPDTVPNREILITKVNKRLLGARIYICMECGRTGGTLVVQKEENGLKYYVHPWHKKEKDGTNKTN
jgi:hypothetical protein